MAAMPWAPAARHWGVFWGVMPPRARRREWVARVAAWWSWSRPRPGVDELAVDAFFEDGAEEEEVEAGGVGGGDLGEGVAGGADDGGGAARVGEGGVDAVEVLGGGSGGEVDAVGAGGDGDFDGTVEEEPWG